jgi:acyl-CoA synthetase (AMP-forming)/AMP-acid ligase II
LNLLAPFLEQAALWRDRTAIVAGDGESLTFGALAQSSARVAAGWRAGGLKAGDRVLVAMPIGLSLYVAIAALWRLGATIVFPEPALGLAGLRQAARTTAPRAFLATGWYRALGLLPELRGVEHSLTMAPARLGEELLFDAPADHPALISFTSGSTGAPKAILRTHGFLAAQNACVAELLRPKAEGAVDLVVFPVFVIANLGLGVTSVLPNWKVSRHDLVDPAALARHIQAHNVTRALAPPSICEALAAAPRAPGLKTVMTGGGPVFPDLLRRLAQKLGGDDIVAVYGSTEAEPIAHVRFDEIGEADWRAMETGTGLLAGRPVSAIRAEIVDEEIVVAGDHVNKGYLDPARNAETKLTHDHEIWHRTGDSGYFDEAGRLWLRGRREARAGRYAPFGVETAARLWRGVRQAALLPGSDPPTLFLEGDAGKAAIWSERAGAFPGLAVRPLKAIPLDRRHRSKVDYGALRTLAGARLS